MENRQEFVMKELKNDPVGTYLNYVYGASIYNWALISHQLRLFIGLIGARKNLCKTSLYSTGEWGGKKWLDGRPLVKHFTRVCEENPSYSDIPRYEDFKQSLSKAVNARDRLVHDLIPTTMEHFWDYASKNPTTPLKEGFLVELRNGVEQCYQDIGGVIPLLSDVAPQIRERLGDMDDLAR